MGLDTDMTSCRVAVLDDWQDAARASADWSPLGARATLEFFGAPFASEDEAAEKLAPFDIILAMRERTPFPASLIRRLPRLRMFSLTGSRAGLVDLRFMMERGMTVCYTDPGPGAESTAELALTLILTAARDIYAASAATRSGHFQRGTKPGLLLAGKTLGLVGLGKIGARVAMFGNALGMKVQAWSQNLTSERAVAAGAVLVSKDELVSTSDVVSLHLVLSERTMGIISRDDLAKMKPGAILVNTSRAKLIDETALIEAVQAQRIVAALDVFEQEPLPADHPLASQRSAVLTPHLGYSTREVFAVFYPQLVENTLAFLDGKPIRTMSL
jgi:phosphoglycerate dehydrogenase-like enzyme